MAELQLEAALYHLSAQAHAQATHPELLSDAAQPPNGSCKHCLIIHQAEAACMERLLELSPCIKATVKAALGHESIPESDSGAFSIREVQEEEASSTSSRITTIKLLILATRHLPDSKLPSFPCGSSPLESKCTSMASDLVSAISGCIPPPPSPDETKLQALIIALAREMVPMMRQALKASVPSTEFNSNEGDLYKSKLDLKTGSTYDRFGLSRSLSSIVRALNKTAITQLLPLLIPAIMTILDDPSPFVKVNGCWAVHHLSVTATIADLLWQKDLLLDLVLRSILGADEFTWPHALQASVSLVMAIEGSEARSNGYHQIMSYLLTEAERGIHIKAKRLPFLLHVSPLIEAMGLTILRYIARLMPLVLESVHSYDVESRSAAVHLLFIVIKCSWVRISSHLSLLLHHLDAAFDRDWKLVRKLNQDCKIMNFAVQVKGDGAGSESMLVINDILKIFQLLIKVEPDLLSHFEERGSGGSKELRDILMKVQS